MIMSFLKLLFPAMAGTSNLVLNLFFRQTLKRTKVKDTYLAILMKGIQRDKIIQILPIMRFHTFASYENRNKITFHKSHQEPPENT